MTQPEPAHCGRAEFHAGHPFLRLEVLFQCPGASATQPEPAQPRPAACILDACTQACTTECREAINRAWTSLRGTQRVQPTDRPGIDNLTSDMLDRLYTRLDKAERAVNLLADSHRRAERAEAALTAVRDELDRIAKLPTVNTTGPCDSFSTGVRWAIRMIRENVLDQHGQTPA